MVVGDQRKTAACHSVILLWLGNARRRMSYVTPQVYHALGNLSMLTPCNQACGEKHAQHFLWDAAQVSAGSAVVGASCAWGVPAPRPGRSFAALRMTFLDRRA